MTAPGRWATLVCLDEAAAKAVYVEAHRDGDELHNVKLDGRNIQIKYLNPRWPIDVAEWAFENGYAHDDDAARVIWNV